MDLFKAISSRRSMRRYQDTPVSRDLLRQVLEAGRLAPSWKNSQCWQVIVVEDAETRKKVGEAANHNPDISAYESAPYLLVVCADPAAVVSVSDKQYWMTDIGIFMEHMLLAATALGLGTCWVGAFPEEPIKEILGVPESNRIVCMTPLGVPAKESAPRPRKELAEIVVFNHWGNTRDF